MDMVKTDWLTGKTLRKIKEGVNPIEAFAWAADDENYYGNHPDAVRYRQFAAAKLRGMGYTSITDAIARMDPVQILELRGTDVPAWYKGATGSGFGEKGLGG